METTEVKRDVTEKRRGRKPKGEAALSGAERSRSYRSRKSSQEKDFLRILCSVLIACSTKTGYSKDVRELLEALEPERLRDILAQMTSSLSGSGHPPSQHVEVQGIMLAIKKAEYYAAQRLTPEWKKLVESF